ncbi:TOPRIM nucleotidyl transferase/hydrolase domain-containing protein [Luteimicrobium sp. NPDC057192]|uniref:TOPRIM nucleotidyl transferase/hydrolase domain-containing protein n=1 Tax=Luteimicrobium sp. NPDC057192 TaxID=3346042 RepID=UPI003641C65C
MPTPGTRTAILVEGTSDQAAVEALAVRLGHDLGAEGVVVLPIGGAHALAREARRLGPAGAGLRLVGLCDEAEEPVFRRGLAQAGVATPSGRAELEDAGFFVCVRDLEDELLRAVGVAGAERLLEAQGDLRAFRTLQGQPTWRGRDPLAQLRRFLGAGARRKHRYGRLLAEAVDVDRVPRPLGALLARL